MARRPEITGKKPGVSADQQGPTIPPLAYTIDEFCAVARISKRTYFNLRDDGLGPKETRPDPRRRVVLIRVETAHAWMCEREAATAAAAEKENATVNADA